MFFNSTADQINVGANGAFNSHFFSGYIAEVHFIDGQALAPSDFGEYDSDNNWNPIDCKNNLTYGTNGFYLKFADNSSNAALGTDSSGNNNTFTVHNLTAKAPGDYDAPQNFGVVTYTGNGSTQSISNLNFQPDFVWIKQRNTTRDNVLFDSVRGANEVLYSNATTAEATYTNTLNTF